MLRIAGGFVAGAVKAFAMVWLIELNPGGADQALRTLPRLRSSAQGGGINAQL